MSEEIKKENTSYEEMIQKLPEETQMLTVVKRGRGRPRKENGQKKVGAVGNYFKSVEDNIMEYLNEDCQIKKNKIFKTHIHMPIYHMIETIYRDYFNGKRHNYIFDETDEEIINDTYSFLITKLDKYSPNMVSRKYPDGRFSTAYSYYQAIIKNYIRLKTLNTQKRLRRDMSYESYAHDINNDERNSYQIDEAPVANQLILDMIQNINKELSDKNSKLKPNDIKVGFALIDVLKGWDNLFPTFGSQKYNKSTIMFFIQESTLLTTKEVNNSMKKFKNLYFNLKKEII